MKNHEIIEVLRRLKGEADAPTHRRALRYALISRSHRGHSFAALQHLVIYFGMKKYYFSGGALAAVALVGILTFSTNNAVAQAQEQVARSYARATQISPEMREQLESHMKADMLETLAEAKAAPDLRILTKEEFEKESPFTISKVAPMDLPPLPEGVEGEAGQRVVTFSHNIAVSSTTEEKDVVFNARVHGVASGTGAHGAMMMGGMGAGEPVKYLSYTDPRGNKTVLGLDKNDTPVFKFTTISESNVQHFPDGTIGIEGKEIQILHTENQ
jgi:hypothetical protein